MMQKMFERMISLSKIRFIVYWRKSNELIVMFKCYFGKVLKFIYENLHLDFYQKKM